MLKAHNPWKMAVIEFSRNIKTVFAIDIILLCNYKKLAKGFRKPVFWCAEHMRNCQTWHVFGVNINIGQKPIRGWNV